MKALEASSLLNELSMSGRVSRRMQELLRPPDGSEADDWFIYLPSSFNDALDIKLNCGAPNPGWTQAGGFAFRVGDRLFDSPKAYERWADALSAIQYCFEVTSAASAGSSPDGRRYPGMVKFIVSTVNRERSKLVRVLEDGMTQDEFVRMLIVGPEGEFARKLEEVVP